jgi:hypothetical protein
METKLESTHTWFEDLSFHDRLFGVDEDGVVGLGWGDGNRRAWAPFDTGLELVAVEDHDHSGCTHYWAFTEPLTTPAELYGLDRIKAVTVYSQHYVYCGPEEGGWGVWKQSPLAVFLVDQGEVEDVAVQRAEAAADKWVAGNEYNEDDVLVLAEPFPLSHTSVGRHYYC